MLFILIIRLPGAKVFVERRRHHVLAPEEHGHRHDAKASGAYARIAQRGGHEEGDRAQRECVRHLVVADVGAVSDSGPFVQTKIGMIGAP